MTELKGPYVNLSASWYKEANMGRMVITDKPKPGLEFVETMTRRRITPEEIEAGLGADWIARV